MSGIDQPRFLTHPHEVITEAVAAVEPDLEPAVVAEVVGEIAVLKPRLRALAEALHTDPELLTSGRPEGPKLVGMLIRALRARGAAHVVLPRCAGCGKQHKLTSLDDENRRICGYCAIKRREAACGKCGRTTAVVYRDRDGTPRCQSCPPATSGNPVDQIAAHVQALDPALAKDVLAALIAKAVPLPAQQHRVAWDIDENPALLTGQGADGSPRLLALVTALVAHGTKGVVPAPCPVCDAQVELTHRRDGVRCCRRCYDQPRTARCCRCGVTKRIATRSMDGKAICHVCSRRDPLNFQRCTRCGRQATPVVNNSEQTLCPRCYRPPMATCSVCGRRKPCFLATTNTPRCWSCTSQMREPETCVQCGNHRLVQTRTTDGSGLCGSCSVRTDTCSSCGQSKQVYGRAPEGPLCRSCFVLHPVSLRHCSECGNYERLYRHGLCTRCACVRLLRDLLSDTAGIVRPAVAPVVDALATSQPYSVLLWLREAPPRRVLAAIATADGPVTHELLDSLDHPQAVTRLRASLVAHAVLPDRDEHLAAIERWLGPFLDHVDDAGERKVVRSFVTWHHLRRLRHGFPQRRTTFEQAVVVKRETRVAVLLLAWLRARGTTLASCDQGDIDQWLDEGTSYQYSARNFVLWSVRRGHAHTITVPIYAQSNLRPAFIEADERWSLARRLLHEDDLDIVDRVVGLLLLLYAQPLARIATLSLDQLTQRITDRAVQLSLGNKPLVLPPPLDGFVLELADRRHGHAVVGRTLDLAWFLPGGAPGRPISARQLMRRLHRLGIRARLSRNTALMDLAAQLPATVLSDLLNLHIGTATAWNELAGNTRSGYAAELSQRRRRDT